MKKALKELIKKEKLSDDAIIKLISNRSKPKAPTIEKDVMDEEDEPEQTDDSEDQSNAEETTAEKESTQAETPPASKEKAKTLSVKTLEELIQKAVTTALESKDPKLPAQLPLKKPEPKPKPKKEAELGLIAGEFNLIG